jgi:hypothetical protein
MKKSLRILIVGNSLSLRATSDTTVENAPLNGAQHRRQSRAERRTRTARAGWRRSERRVPQIDYQSPCHSTPMPAMWVFASVTDLLQHGRQSVVGRPFHATLNSRLSRAFFFAMLAATITVSRTPFPCPGFLLRVCRTGQTAGTFARAHGVQSTVVFPCPLLTDRKFDSGVPE